MRKVIGVKTAMTAHMPGLKTWRAMPTPNFEMLDPYLFMNHHGPEDFPPHSKGLPFGPHPHRGFETLTFIVDGELVHKDSQGFESRILKGGIQWMTAGSGIIHSETSSQEFIEKGGSMEILQLWINLPARLKSTPPHYQGFQKESIPAITLNEGVVLNLISGSFKGQNGPVTSPYPQFMSTIEAQASTSFELDSTADELYFYVVSGSLEVNGQLVNKRQTVLFEGSAGQLDIKVHADAYIIFGQAPRIQEPVYAHGPFVMNTEAEIHEAIKDYQEGKMGVWRD